jgi:hypothetical protein
MTWNSTREPDLVGLLRGVPPARKLERRNRALAGIVLTLALTLCGATFSEARIRFTGVGGTDFAGVAAAEEGIWFSSHTHRDWQEASGAGGGRTYTGVLATSDDHFTVVADDGTVWRSTTTQASGFVEMAQLGAALRALIETNSQLLVVGDGGYIARSSGLTGGSWVPLASSISSDLLAIATNGISSTIAVGEGGIVLRAGLGGTGWQAVPIAETRTLRALVVDSNSRYLAVGDGGAAWQSDAAGLVWEPVDLGTESNLRGASRLGQAVVVVGDAQTVLYSPANFSAWQTRVAPSVDGAGNYDLLAVNGTGTPDWVAVGTGRATIWSDLGLQWISGDVTPVITESWGRIKGRFVP